MLATYFPLLVLLLLSSGAIAFLIFLSIAIGPQKRSEIKQDPFECGTLGTGDARGRFGVRFYLVALLFVLFDIEIVFMYPWAVGAIELGWYGFCAMLSFVSVLAVGLAYVWKRGVLDWN